MPRSKRAVIDNAAEFGFANYGTDWSDRGVEQAYTGEPVAPEDDCKRIWLPAPVRLPDGTVTDTVTIWGRGLVTFGAPTDEQRAYMAMLPGATDLHAFLENFPGGYIDAGLQASAYGDMEYGGGVQDFVPNPFGVFHDPGDPSASGAVKFDHDQARGYAYVTWSGEPYEGSADDYDGLENVPIGPGGLNSVQFSDEGIQIGGRGELLHFGETDVAVGGNGFVYYSELNPVALTAEANVANVIGGPEQLIGLGGADRLTGGAHADRLDGGDDNDVLVGGGGVDRLFGDDGDDDLSDGDEQGLLSGGAGNDVLRPGGGEDTIDGGEGADRVVLDYASWGGAIAFTLDQSKTNYLLPGDLYKSIANVEAVTFTAGGGDDRLTGAGGDDVFTGGGGQDALSGGSGADTLSGGANRDLLEGGAGDDWLDGGTGEGPWTTATGSYLEASLDTEPFQLFRITQSVNGSIGTSPTYGWSGSLTFTIYDPNSQYLSLSSSEIVSDAPDFIGSYSWGLYRIEDNNDLTLVNASSTNIFIEDFWFEQAGRYLFTVDTLDDDPAHLSLQALLHGLPVPDGDTMIGGIGDDSYVVDSIYDRVLENAGEGRDTIVTALDTYSLATLPDIERLVGDASLQALTGNAGNNTIQSGGGADALDGAGGDDVLVITETPTQVEGGAGVDTLVIAARASVTLGADLVSGVEKVLVRAGATLDGSALADPLAPLRSVSSAAAGATIIGTGGADRITGGAGADTLVGGAGDDLIALTHQTAAIDGGSGFDTLTLGGASGTVFAFADASLAGVERILVGSGTALDLTGLFDAPLHIRLTGGAQVAGSEGGDRIRGSADADVISGGGGGDRMTGGGGADRFVFLAVADSPQDAKPRDSITDFDGAQGDRIDLSALSDEGFTVLGSGAFTGTAATTAEVRVVSHGDRWAVQVDIDHDARADVSFSVHAAAPLTVGDFAF